MFKKSTNYGSISDPEVGFSGPSSSHDIGAQFNTLCDDIVTNIYTINMSSKTLQDIMKLIGTPKDNEGVRNKIHVTQLSTNQVASAVTKDFAKLRSLKTDKARLLQTDKLEDDFKATVNKYHNVQKELAAKQKANMLLSTQSESEPQDENTQQNQAQLTRELEFEQGMLQEREERVRQIESDVLDVNQIMRELAQLVHQQGEKIDTIENSIDHTAGNVQQGAEQVVKAGRYMNRRRKSLLILVVIATIIAIIIISVIVSEVKK